MQFVSKASDHQPAEQVLLLMKTFRCNFMGWFLRVSSVRFSLEQVTSVIFFYVLCLCLPICAHMHIKRGIPCIRPAEDRVSTEGPLCHRLFLFRKRCLFSDTRVVIREQLHRHTGCLMPGMQSLLSTLVSDHDCVVGVFFNLPQLSNACL